MKIAPSFVKIDKAVHYPTDALEAWDERNGVQCRVSQRRNEHVDDHLY